ncbi:MAG: septum formation protein Maf [Acidimicrobiaceae bacterium]|nr:septum formation protein Maf [Acidimicrobiaceae bacterium]
MTSRVVLASRSPRRKDILQQLGIDFVIDPPDIDETPHTKEAALGYVQRISAAKADLVAKRHPQLCVVIAADTTVELDGEIFGQPQDLDEARAMLTRLTSQLSNRTHNVHTAVSVRYDGHCLGGVETASVTMRVFTDELLDWYLGTGESLGKAGAYAVQGHGSALVVAVTGDLSTVIGLPVALLTSLIEQCGIDLASLQS